MANRSLSHVGVTIVVLALLLGGPAAQSAITTPKQHFGFDLGDDYQLANYTQIADYWRTLDTESDRIVVQEIGKTSEGRPHLMAIVTSPENHRNLRRYQDISRRLAFAQGVTEDEARRLAGEGKAVVWIDGGLHANETLGAQQLARMVYEMASASDAETLRFLNDCIVLFVHANPDGNELVANWYMRNPDPQRRSLANLPRLYHFYIGHDNNRDFFASTQKETENISRVLYHDWMPQLLYNHHQSGPAGTVAWSSPQRDPYNYNLDPLLILGLQALGTHMHQRLAAEGRPGLTMAAGGPYDGWWNGGIRNTGNFHNIIAILTETIGNPTPMRIPFVPARQIPNRDHPYPIAPQEWHFRQSVDYSMSFNRAVIDYASRNREHLLFNIYKMGQRGIQRGSEDTWTPSPTRINAVDANDPNAWASLRKPELRDPRAYIVPANQPDFLTAIKFINALREVNVTVHRATADFEAGGTRYPSGSFVVFTAQAFRPHVMDMFEPQDHPNVIPYPGAAPTPPYDNAGWTLAFQMGVHFDRMLEPITGPFEKVTDWNLRPPAGRVETGPRAAAYALSRSANDAVRAVNRMLKAGESVRVGTAGMTAGGTDATFYFGNSAQTRARLETIAKDLGLSFSASAAVPEFTKALRTPRIGLWDQYGGSMPSGWTRWILEQFEFPFSRVFAPELDAGNLRAKFDALIFVDGAIQAGGEGGGRGGGRGGTPLNPEDVPEEFRSHIGRVTADRTIPQLRQFVEAGGTLIAIGSSAQNISRLLSLPLENHLVENGQAIPRARYFVPGSLLTAHVDGRQPVAAGLPERVDVFFDNSPVFRLAPGAANKVRVIATFETDTPLKSGWAWGQTYLKGGIAAAEVPLGSGRVFLFGPEILQRAQPHGTFKFLFNSLILAGEVH